MHGSSAQQQCAAATRGGTARQPCTAAVRGRLGSWARLNARHKRPNWSSNKTTATWHKIPAVKPASTRRTPIYNILSTVSYLYAALSRGATATRHPQHPHHHVAVGEIKTNQKQLIKTKLPEGPTMPSGSGSSQAGSSIRSKLAHVAQEHSALPKSPSATAQDRSNPNSWMDDMQWYPRYYSSLTIV